MVRHAIDVGGRRPRHARRGGAGGAGRAGARRTRELLARLDEHVRGDALVTDVGSTKRAMVEAARTLPSRLRVRRRASARGRGPSGIEFGSPDLFAGRPWFLTPGGSDPRLTPWRGSRAFVAGAVGASPRLMDAAAHDALLAMLSHLPQLAASALMHVVGDAVGEGGTRDSPAGACATRRGSRRARGRLDGRRRDQRRRHRARARHAHRRAVEPLRADLPDELPALARGLRQRPGVEAACSKRASTERQVAATAPSRPRHIIVAAMTDAPLGSLLADRVARARLTRFRLEVNRRWGVSLDDSVRALAVLGRAARGRSGPPSGISAGVVADRVARASVEHLGAMPGRALLPRRDAQLRREPPAWTTTTGKPSCSTARMARARRLTLGELRHDVAAMAAALRDVGVQAGDRVGGVPAEHARGGRSACSRRRASARCGRRARRISAWPACSIDSVRSRRRS